ncbi:hypothetical protein DPM19_33625 [Actinomadura craniellae]|uniref:Uncharacterized protein n=1 Tax=Actinomadura craniellae TaxID=2231787 RepID=A0A365GVC8_9ACTN|nr:hypothetical protein DPM19_33625 [Actinomadura craniellae]
MLVEGGVALQQAAPGLDVCGADGPQVDAVLDRPTALTKACVPTVLRGFADQDGQQVQLGAAELVADPLGGTGAVRGIRL